MMSTIFQIHTTAPEKEDILAFMTGINTFTFQLYSGLTKSEKCLCSHLSSYNLRIANFHNCE